MRPDRVLCEAGRLVDAGADAATRSRDGGVDGVVSLNERCVGFWRSFHLFQLLLQFFVDDWDEKGLPLVSDEQRGGPL